MPKPKRTKQSPVSFRNWFMIQMVGVTMKTVQKSEKCKCKRRSLYIFPTWRCIHLNVCLLAHPPQCIFGKMFTTEIVTQIHIKPFYDTKMCEWNLPQLSKCDKCERKILFGIREWHCMYQTLRFRLFLPISFNFLPFLVLYWNQEIRRELHEIFIESNGILYDDKTEV